MKNLGFKQSNVVDTKRIKEVINKFYEHPVQAVNLIVSFDSEYNDSTYDNKIEYVGVYNKLGHEIHPMPGVERDARHALKEAASHMVRGQMGESSEPLEDKVISLNGIPELYVKESN